VPTYWGSSSPTSTSCAPSRTQVPPATTGRSNRHAPRLRNVAKHVQVVCGRNSDLAINKSDISGHPKPQKPPPTLSIPKHTSNPRPSLQHSRPYLIRRQCKPIRALIPQLVRVRICRITRDISVISRRTSRSIKRRAAGANGVCCTGDSADSGLGAGGDGAVLGVVFGAQVAVVAVGPEDVLAVGAGVWLVVYLFVSGGLVGDWRRTARRGRDGYHARP